MSSALRVALAGAMPSGERPRVLDCGGGSGTFAVPLAADGADVTVVDISADALATLRRRADEAGVSDVVHALPGDVESLSALVAADLADQPDADLPDADRFDAVLAHGILDAVDDPAAVFAEMTSLVRAGGVLSVLVANPAAAVVARALAGEPAHALAELRRLDEVDRRIGPAAVARLATELGLVVESRRGVGVFSDLVPGSAGDTPGGREALSDLDAEAADRAPFADIAGRIHLIVRRPAPGRTVPAVATDVPGRPVGA